MTAVRTPPRAASAGASAAPSRIPARRPSAPARLTIAEVPRSRAGNRLVLAAVGMVLLLAVLSISVSQALQVQTQDRLDDLQGQIVVQQQLAESQRLELAELQSPVRIVDTATERLGMVVPDEVVYLWSDPADDNMIAVGGNEPVDASMAAGIDG